MADSWQAGYDTLLKQMGAIQGTTDVYKRGSPLSADRHMQNIAKSLAKDYGITSIGDIGVRYETRPAYESGSDESRTVIPEEQLPVYYNKKNPDQVIPGYKFASENEGNGYSEYNLQPVPDGKGGTIALPIQQYSKSGMGAFAQDIAPIMPVINMALLASGVPPLTVAAGNVAFQGAAGNIHDIGDVLRTGAPIVAADPGILGGVAKLYSAYQAFDKGQVLSGLASLASFGGMDQTANGLRFVNAVKTGNIPGALTALSQMPEVSGFELKDELGNVLKNADGTVKTLGNTKIGGENGLSLGDASKAATIASTLMSSNPNYGLALQLAGDLAKSPDTVMAGKAATIMQTLSSPNPNPTLLYNAALSFAQTTNAKAPGTAPVDDRSANTAVRVAAGDTGDVGANAILSASNAVGQNLTGTDGLTQLAATDLGTTRTDASGDAAATDTSGKPKIPSIDLAVNKGGVQSGSGSNIQTGYGGIVTTGAPADRLERLNTLVDQNLDRSWASQDDAPPGTPAPLGGWTVEAYSLADPFAKSNYSLPEGWRFLEPADESSSTPFTTVLIDNVRYAVTKPGLEADTSIPQSTARLPRGFPTDSTNTTGGENNSLRVSDIVGNNPLATSGAQTGAPAGASTGTPQLTAEQVAALTIANTNGLLAGDLGANAGNPSNSTASSNASATSPSNTVASNLGVLASDLNANANSSNPNGTPGGTLGGTPGGALTGTTSPTGQLTANQIAALNTTGILRNTNTSGTTGGGTTDGTPGGGPAGTTSGVLTNTSSQITGLSSAQIAALVTSQIGGGTTGGILTNTSSPITALTSTPIGGALSSALKTLNTTQITALTSAPPALTSAPVTIPTTQLTSIVPALTSGFTTLTTSQIAAVTSGFPATLTSGFTTLTSTQAPAVTSSPPASSTSSTVLTSSQISALTTTSPRGMMALPTSDARYWRQTGAQGTGGKGGVRFFDWYDTPENRTMAPPAMASTNIPAITSQQAEAMVNPAKRYFNQSTNRYYTDPTGQWTPPAGWTQTTFKDGGEVDDFDTLGLGLPTDISTGYYFNDADLGIGPGGGYDGGGYDWAYGDEGAREEDVNSYLRGLPSENASYGGGKDLTEQYQKDIKDAAITGSPTKSLSNPLKSLADAAKANPNLTKALMAAGLGGLLGYMGRPKGFSPKGMQGNSLGLTQAQVHGALKGVPVKRAEGGGIDGYAGGGGLHYLKSAEDGMADKIPATIDNKQPAKLSGGEFVIPADVVSHLGNGNSEAGAKQLYDMMDRIRHARTGNKQQGKQINPAKFTPK